jgi:hypothetical protein
MRLRAVEYVLECANCHGRLVIKVVPLSERWRENFVCPYCHAVVIVTSDLEQRPGYGT